MKQELKWLIRVAIWILRREIPMVGRQVILNKVVAVLLPSHHVSKNPVRNGKSIVGGLGK